MIAQLKVLLRLKELREERALRTVNAKRNEVAEALVEIEYAGGRVRDSATTLPAREDAIYDSIIGRVVDHDDIEEVKSQVWVLESQHAKLVDEAERAMHVHTRMEKQLKEAVEAHRKTVRDRDKYAVLTEEIGAGVLEQIAYREEIEVEDIFGTRRRRSA